jgi:hypothetical protein
VRRRIRTGWLERAALRFGWARGRPPTDFELLRAIYERHDDDFAGSEERRTRVYLPIDIPAIAKDLADVNADMIAGRLRYDLDRRYADVGHTHLFQGQLAGEANLRTISGARSGRSRAPRSPRTSGTSPRTTSGIRSSRTRSTPG